MKIELLTLKIALLIAICLINIGCGNGNSPRADYSELLLRLEEGDLLFRKGTGIVGHIVTSVDNRGEFSHVGIVVRRGDEWQVIHAVPHEPDFEGDFDRVKIESVDSFLGRYPNATIGHYRTTLASEQVAIAVLNATRLCNESIPFDHDYDLSDTTHLYCTEFVEYVYSLAGISLSEGRRTELSFPALSGSYIMPSDLTESSYLKPIY